MSLHCLLTTHTDSASTVSHLQIQIRELKKSLQICFEIMHERARQSVFIYCFVDVICCLFSHFVFFPHLLIQARLSMRLVVHVSLHLPSSSILDTI